MNHSLFSEKMKLADLVLTNYRLLYVLPCFSMGLGFGEATVKQACELNKVSTPLFLLVCNVYTFDEYKPDNSISAQIPLKELVDYLRNAHKDYLETRLPKIINQVLQLVESCHVGKGDVILSFCEKYRQEVITHFDYEEQIVFPYIDALLTGEKAYDYSIQIYEGNHSNIDAALNDLKSIIIKYLPDECTVEKCREVLIDLFLFESDLSKHALLEDQILVSLVEGIENSGKNG